MSGQPKSPLPLAARVAARAIAAIVLAVGAAAGRGSGAALEPRSVVAPSATGPARAFYATPFQRTPTPAELTALGRELFFDAGLSATGRISCATCHDPRFAHGPPDAAATPRGGASGLERGFRAVPSLRYLHRVPSFTEHMHDTDGDDGADQGPAGGLTWDGRAPSAHDQARLPLLSPLEMANATPDAVVARLRRARYAERFRAGFGEHVLDDPTRAFNAALLALEVFQQDPAEFFPYSSKYDEHLRGRASLTEPERRGLALFNDPRKGNCASCHPSSIRSGAFPVFTDFGFAALGVPRNADIPANRDPAFFDLGLCGPARRDLVLRTAYCGMFRTPSLRNVALRRSFFHNGALHTLDGVIEFYVDRDRAAGRWYPRGRDGRVHRYDDLPAPYASNVHAGAPFDRRPGDAPALSRGERADVIAFLRTLTDGYRGDAAGAASRSPAGDRGPGRPVRGLPSPD